MRCGFLLTLGLSIALVLGCGQRKPYLRPPLEPDQLTPPPVTADGRYDTPNMPDQILTTQDDLSKKKAKQDNLDPSKMGPSMGGAGGGGGGRGM